MLIQGLRRQLWQVRSECPASIVKAATGMCCSTYSALGLPAEESCHTTAPRSLTPAVHAGLTCGATKCSLGSGSGRHPHLHRPAEEPHHLPGHHLGGHSRPGRSLRPAPLAESPGQADWPGGGPLQSGQVRKPAGCAVGVCRTPLTLRFECRWSTPIHATAALWLTFVTTIFMLPAAYPVTTVVGAPMAFALVVGPVLLCWCTWSRRWFGGPMPDVYNSEVGAGKSVAWTCHAADSTLFGWLQIVKLKSWILDPPRTMS